MSMVEYWKTQAGMMREQADRLRERVASGSEPHRQREFLALAGYCEEAAANMEQFAPGPRRANSR